MQAETDLPLTESHPPEPRPSVEYYARQMAFWHGQKMHSRIKGETFTVARIRGSGSPDAYSGRHWQEYTACAEYIMDRFHKEPADASR